MAARTTRPGPSLSCGHTAAGRGSCVVSMVPPFGDEQVTLRDWRDEDVGNLAMWLRPGHRWQDLDAPYFPQPSDAERDAVIDKMRERVHQVELPTPRRGLVVAATADQRFLGEVGWYWESEATDWRRMGIALYDPGSWNRGIGTGAMQLWTNYLFASTQVRRLDFATWSGNAPGVAPRPAASA